MTDTSYPMRINKYLAMQGYATRRGADTLVEQKRVRINGRVAELGDKVNEGDTVEVKQKGKAVERVYLAYNKPRGVITHSPGEDETDIQGATGRTDLFPIGRLDKDSHGLIILTNDGRITDRLLNPAHAHEKEYAVKTKQKVTPWTARHLEAGVNIEGFQTAPAQVSITGDTSFTITLTEGKKHQVRRMVVALKNEVEDLKRIRIMNIRLGKLRPGETRPIEGEELVTFLKALGL